MHMKVSVIFLAMFVSTTCANVEKIFFKTLHRISATPDPDCNLIPCISPPYTARILSGNQTVSLRGLQPHSQYEVRVCWSATNPADYSIRYDDIDDSIKIEVIPSGVRMPLKRDEVDESFVYELIIESTLFGVLPLSSLRVIGLCLLALAMTPYIVDRLWKHIDKEWDKEKGRGGLIRKFAV